jgi:hypothetical protein
MFDGAVDTCWNSDQGGNQYILIDFGISVIPWTLYCTFQGGFVGQNG